MDIPSLSKGKSLNRMLLAREPCLYFMNLVTPFIWLRMEGLPLQEESFCEHPLGWYTVLLVSAYTAILKEKMCN